MHVVPDAQPKVVRIKKRNSPSSKLLLFEKIEWNANNDHEWTCKNDHRWVIYSPSGPSLLSRRTRWWRAASPLKRAAWSHRVLRRWCSLAFFRARAFRRIICQASTAELPQLPPLHHSYHHCCRACTMVAYKQSTKKKSSTAYSPTEMTSPPVFSSRGFGGTSSHKNKLSYYDLEKMTGMLTVHIVPLAWWWLHITLIR